MSNSDLWEISIKCAVAEYLKLDASVRERADDFSGRIMAIKSDLSSLFDSVNGGDACRLCRGECCQTGCFHFTAIDLMAYLKTGRKLFSPRFDNGACPYLGDDGCLMEPQFRPYNCVTFICDLVEAGMDPVELRRFSELSETLIGVYRNMEELFANRFVSGILNNGSRFVEGRSQGILWS